MPAKQTPHARHTIHKRALKTIYFPPLLGARGKNEIFQFVSLGSTVVFHAVWSNVTMCQVTPGICQILGRPAAARWQDKSWNEIKYVVWSPGACQLVTPYISIFSWQQTLRQAPNEKEGNFSCYHFSERLLAVLSVFPSSLNFSLFQLRRPPRPHDVTLFDPQFPSRRDPSHPRQGVHCKKFFGLRQEPKESLCRSVLSIQHKVLSRSLNLHLSLSQVSLKPL